MTSDALRCACPGCEVVLSRVRTAGRVQRFCSPKCRCKDYALRHPRADRAHIIQPGYVALPREAIVAPGGAQGVQAGVLVADVMGVAPPCPPVGEMLTAALEARLADLEPLKAQVAELAARPRFGRSSGQDPTRWKHGRNCYRNHGCRCEVCVEGNRAKSKARRLNRRPA